MLVEGDSGIGAIDSVHPARNRLLLLELDSKLEIVLEPAISADQRAPGGDILDQAQLAPAVE